MELQARVKVECRWPTVMAFGGVSYTKEEWTAVPAGHEKQAYQNDYLDIREKPEPSQDALDAFLEELIDADVLEDTDPADPTPPAPSPQELSDVEPAYHEIESDVPASQPEPAPAPAVDAAPEGDEPKTEKKTTSRRGGAK